VPVPHTDDFWQYALSVAVAYIRAAANRADMPVRAGMPRPRPVPWPPSAITASSGASKTAVPDG
jgi:hypothetical protein